MISFAYVGVNQLKVKVMLAEYKTLELILSDCSVLGFPAFMGIPLTK